MWFGERNKAGDPSRETRDCHCPQRPQLTWQHPHQQGAARNRILLRSQHTSSKNESKHGNEGRDHGCSALLQNLDSFTYYCTDVSLNHALQSLQMKFSTSEFNKEPQLAPQMLCFGEIEDQEHGFTNIPAKCLEYRFSEKMNCVNITARGTKTTNGTKNLLNRHHS